MILQSSYFIIYILVGPPDADSGGIAEIKAWVEAMRESGATPKAVLPDTPANSHAIINFATGGIVSGGKTYDAAQYCSRIAGLIAGTPATMAGTFAPLPEVERVETLTKAAMDAAIDAGKLIIFSDGSKTKVGRAVNSLATPAAGLNDSFKKIKVVEIMDMINDDVRRAAEDTYIGKYANSYDNKCLLITSIRGYLAGLERDGLLAPGKSTVELDVEAQEKYLIGKGVDVSEMSAQDVKEANTGSEVFLAASVSILDAIEDITLNITV